jgi:sugar lactone lactonase YvrE
MKGKIWMVDTSSGSITSEINPSGTFTEAITKGPDDYLFVTDWGQRLYKARLDGDKLNVESEISLAPEHPAGILWNGTKFFVITWKRSIFGTRFYILEIDTNLKITRKVEIKAIQEPDHLAWDGNYLWISSWYSRAVYKVDIDRWEIVGAFASPVSRTTGIAWDGKYFWLTGTHSDLYKLEVGI